MDLGFRNTYSRKPNNNSVNFNNQPKMVFGNLDNRTSNGPSALDKYSRRLTNQRKTIVQPAFAAKNRNSQSTEMRKSNLNKYYRAEAAPKNQFKRYLLDTKNVFYEQRQSLVKIKFFNQLKWISLLLWVVLAIVYFLIYRIQPFDGICPQNAYCGVFVHCFAGYEYKAETNECVISSDLLDQVEKICMDSISRLKQQYGQQDCKYPSQEYRSIPSVNLNEILIHQNPSIKYQVISKMQNLLLDPDLQNSQHFTYNSRTRLIEPTKKQHTWNCAMHLFFQTKNFKIGFPTVLIIAFVSVIAFMKIAKTLKAKQIYSQLRKKTLAQKSINISYVKEDLQKQYGQIDQDLWQMIDSYRTKDRDIAFLQDDFLYWKIL